MGVGVGWGCGGGGSRVGWCGRWAPYPFFGGDVRIFPMQLRTNNPFENHKKSLYMPYVIISLHMIRNVTDRALHYV